MASRRILILAYISSYAPFIRQKSTSKIGENFRARRKRRAKKNAEHILKVLPLDQALKNFNWIFANFVALTGNRSFSSRASQKFKTVSCFILRHFAKLTVVLSRARRFFLAFFFAFSLSLHDGTRY